MGIDALKDRVREIAGRYPDREERARRLFVEERAASLGADPERGFAIRTELATYFGIPYSAVSFCGSAQLGFSVHKDRLFTPAISDLDAACISPELFQRAWADVVRTTRAFTDATPFGHRTGREIELFKQQILRRGMIRIDAMPISPLKREWQAFQNRISKNHTQKFSSISCAIYMNEFAFAWKQDSALTSILEK